MIHLTKVQLLIVWICLHISTQAKGSITHENSIEEKLIMVNPSVTYEDRPGIDCNAGDCFEKDSCTCCDEKNCWCSKFEDALHCVEDSTVILPNGSLENFSSNILLSNITNISIIGYHKLISINCHARGSVVFKNCKNIVIENITYHVAVMKMIGIFMVYQVVMVYQFTRIVIIFMIIFLDYTSTV